MIRESSHLLIVREELHLDRLLIIYHSNRTVTIPVPGVKEIYKKKKRLAVLGSGVLLINGKLLITFSIVLKYIRQIQTLISNSCPWMPWFKKICQRTGFKTVYYHYFFFVFKVFTKKIKVKIYWHSWTKNVLNTIIFLELLFITYIGQLYKRVSTIAME